MDYYESNRQGDVKVNVWCGIHGSKIVGPVFLPDKVNAAIYLNTMKETLGEYLGSLPLSTLSRTYFQQDGAPTHTATAVTNWLDDEFPLQWIGRKGPISWPPRSPDLTPLDFFFWSYVKKKVYHPKPETMDELKSRIQLVCREIPTSTLSAVQQNMVKRLRICMEQDGGIFEHLLKQQARSLT